MLQLEHVHELVRSRFHGAANGWKFKRAADIGVSAARIYQRADAELLIRIAQGLAGAGRHGICKTARSDGGKKRRGRKKLEEGSSRSATWKHRIGSHEILSLGGQRQAQLACAAAMDFRM